jgi:hypothetical protein
MLNCTGGEGRRLLLLDQLNAYGMIEHGPPVGDAQRASVATKRAEVNCLPLGVVGEPARCVSEL